MSPEYMRRSVAAKYASSHLHRDEYRKFTRKYPNLPLLHPLSQEGPRDTSVAFKQCSRDCTMMWKQLLVVSVVLMITALAAIGAYSRGSAEQLDKHEMVMNQVVMNASEAATCCFLDHCTKAHICLPPKSIWPTGCGIAFDVDSQCRLSRKKCCFRDSCSKAQKCHWAFSFYDDSCGHRFGILANCALVQFS